MQMLCKSFVMSEEFEGPCGHYLLEKGFLHVNYVLKRFLVETTWRRTWKLTLGEGLISGQSADKCRCRVWRSMWPVLTGERLSACELCAKTFSSGNNLKMHMKPTLSEGLPNADIEEIVTNIASKSQFWRYISFSTAEKSPCEQCVKIV